MEFKENLKSIRKEKKLSQKKLGELIGKKEITIRNYESGKITPPIKVIEDIAEKLEVPLYKLLGNQEIHNQLWTLAAEGNKNQYSDYIWEKIKEEVRKYDFSTLFENKTDIKSFINDFSLMLRYDLIENHNNISHDDRLKILKDLKKYYDFLINDYNKTQK